MADESPITDHDPVIAAARADASREGARMVKLPLLALWKLIQNGPRLPARVTPVPKGSLQID